VSSVFWMAVEYSCTPRDNWGGGVVRWQRSVPSAGKARLRRSRWRPSGEEAIELLLEDAREGIIGAIIASVLGGVDWALLVTVASTLSSLWLRTTVCRTIVLALLALQTTHQPTLFLSTTPKVMEMKKIQQAGGTCQGEYNPTWLKQPGDNLTLIFGAGLVGYGAILSCVGYYRLATGKGKKE
jgi:hypothetical protein